MRHFFSGLVASFLVVAERAPTVCLSLLQDHIAAAGADVPVESQSDRSRCQKVGSSVSNGLAGCSCGRRTRAEVVGVACADCDCDGPVDGRGSERSGLSGSSAGPLEGLLHVGRSLEVRRIAEEEPVAIAGLEVLAAATVGPVEAEAVATVDLEKEARSSSHHVDLEEAMEAGLALDMPPGGSLTRPQLTLERTPVVWFELRPHSLSMAVKVPALEALEDCSCILNSRPGTAGTAAVEVAAVVDTAEAAGTAGSDTAGSCPLAGMAVEEGYRCCNLFRHLRNPAAGTVAAAGIADTVAGTGLVGEDTVKGNLAAEEEGTLVGNLAVDQTAAGGTVCTPGRRGVAAAKTAGSRRLGLHDRLRVPVLCLLLFLVHCRVHVRNLVRHDLRGNYLRAPSFFSLRLGNF